MCQYGYNNEHMPRKTKRQKLLTAYRRDLSHTISFQPSTSVQENKPLAPSPLPESAVEKSTPQSHYSETFEEKQARTLFLVDFRKSFLLTISILVLEIVLYYASMYTNIGKILFIN